jgi:pre-mRNA cleavage complex 2 protein Pcf11
MSLYPPPPQPQPYGQYPPHHVSQQQPAAAVSYAYAGAQASSPSFYSLDPSSFRRDYAARLTELTLNSRPIIQGLSLYAQEYSRWADTVVECVEAHIRRVRFSLLLSVLPFPTNGLSTFHSPVSHLVPFVGFPEYLAIGLERWGLVGW